MEISTKDLSPSGIKGLYKRISDNEIAPEELKDIIEQIDNVFSREDLQRFLGEDLRLQSQSTLLPMVVESTIQYLQLLDLSETDFYGRLWSYISNPELFESEDDRANALFFTLTSNQLHYVHYDLVSMEDETFDNKTKEFKDEIERIIEICKRPFAQKTQQASALLSIIESKDDIADKAVLLVYALANSPMK